MAFAGEWRKGDGFMVDFFFKFYFLFFVVFLVFLFLFFFCGLSSFFLIFGRGFWAGGEVG